MLDDRKGETYVDPATYTVHLTEEEQVEERRQRRTSFAPPPEDPLTWGELFAHLIVGNSQLSRFTQGVLVGMFIFYVAVL